MVIIWVTIYSIMRLRLRGRNDGYRRKLKSSFIFDFFFARLNNYGHKKILYNSEGATHMKVYVCGVCHYGYEPEIGCPEMDVPPGTAFEDLPDDWSCPLCGVSKSMFEPEE